MNYPKIPHFFEDNTFLSSMEARSLRIVSEYIGPKQRLEKFNIRHTIVFFGSAKIASPESAKRESLSQTQKHDVSIYYEQARELAARLTKWTLTLPEKCRPYFLTGGGPGIMEACNRGAKEAGGISVGAGIHLPREQKINPYCTPEASMQFHYFFTRKFWLLFRTRAIVVFPGGFGTLDELFEVLNLIRTKKKAPIPLILYGSEFWKPLINFQHLLDWDMIEQNTLSSFQFMDSIEEVYQSITQQLTPEALMKMDHE